MTWPVEQAKLVKIYKNATAETCENTFNRLKFCS